MRPRNDARNGGAGLTIESTQVDRAKLPQTGQEKDNQGSPAAVAAPIVG